jgi:hypothetical protein
MPVLTSPMAVNAYAGGHGLHGCGDSTYVGTGLQVEGQPSQGMFGPAINKTHARQQEIAFPFGYRERVGSNGDYVPPADAAPLSLMPWTIAGASGRGTSWFWDHRETMIRAPIQAIIDAGRTPIFHQCQSINDGYNMSAGTYAGIHGDDMRLWLADTFPVMPIVWMGIVLDSDADRFDAGAGTWRTVALKTCENAQAFYKDYALEHGYYYYNLRGEHVSDPYTMLNREAALNPAGTDPNGGICGPNANGRHPSYREGQREVSDCVLGGVFRIRYRPTEP